jgi:hypothetical protein
LFVVVNTKLNPADFASRDMNALKFLQSPQWFRGPDFPWLPEDDWLKLSKNLDILENDSDNTFIPRDARSAGLSFVFT